MNNTNDPTQKPRVIEYTLKVLEINKEDIEERIRKIGGRKIYNKIMTKTLMFDHPILRLRSSGKVLRLRQVGSKVFLSIREGLEGASKSIFQKVVQSELELNDFNQAFQMFEGLGFSAFRYQEKYRTAYTYAGGIKIEIDELPNVPPYLEVEGHSEESVTNIIKKLGFGVNTAVRMTVTDIIRHYGLKDVDIIKFPDSEIGSNAK